MCNKWVKVQPIRACSYKKIRDQYSLAQNDTLIKNTMGFVKDYGINNGYSYILGRNVGESVLFGKEENDLTQTILELLNTTYKNYFEIKKPLFNWG